MSTVLGKVTYADREALSNIYHSKDWEVFVRIFGENERHAIHVQMENDNNMGDVMFDQGQIHMIKKIIKGITEAGRSFDREEDPNGNKENTTVYNG